MNDFSIDINNLNKRIIIQEYTSTTKNGFVTKTWDTYKPVWASMNNLYGSEFYSAMSVQAENTVEFVVRYSNALEILLEKGSTKKYRIFWKDRTFNITFVDDIKYQHVWIKIKTLEVG
ncbi:phage head closure protein [Clostridium estertheticum]|uniref:Phage head closure protein n=1 Tax=Clostridium estertheticum TaxID=238834 RepID=A0AA47EL21_9CLOT|nr:phage head closure protein [Clostridium estertheticum]MBU3153900.1 phage head closure protein [Clostridium estertheticum]WAG61324.1 phage head closure protein [Clostridium estertheticum]